jgi:hypothetical protein
MANAGTGMPQAPYFERPREQYLNTPASGFIHLKDQGAKGMLLQPHARAFLSTLSFFVPRPDNS